MGYAVLGRSAASNTKQEANAVRVVLVDDHPMAREAVREVLISRCPHARVVGETDTAQDAVALVEAQEADVVLLDIVLAGPNGNSALRQIRQVRPTCRVLVLTALKEPEFATDALGAGADGYAIKTQDIDELVFAICEVAAGRRYVAPSIQKTLDERGDNGWHPDPVSTLSPREREIFELVVAGYTNQRMSEELFISIKTVETHRSRINRKLGVHSTAQLVRYAVMHQIVAPPPTPVMVTEAASL
jgi:DNA-binding NarL/FixJ family response regulator